MKVKKSDEEIGEEGSDESMEEDEEINFDEEELEESIFCEGKEEEGMEGVGEVKGDKEVEEEVGEEGKGKEVEEEVERSEGKKRGRDEEDEEGNEKKKMKNVVEEEIIDEFAYEACRNESWDNLSLWEDLLEEYSEIEKNLNLREEMKGENIYLPKGKSRFFKG